MKHIIKVRKQIFPDCEEFDIAVQSPSDISSFYGVVLENDYKMLIEKIKPGDIVFDLGANIGAFTLWAAKKVGEKGRIIAVEANPRNFSVLNHNVKLNKLNNVTLYHRAILNNNNVNIHLSGDGMLTHISEEGYAQALSITVDGIIRETGNYPSCIKMDIENAEIFAFESMENSLSRLNFMIAEIHSKQAEMISTCKSTAFNKEEIHIQTNSIISIVRSHPLFFFRLELLNRFSTTSRILKRKNNLHANQYPKLIFYSRSSEPERQV